MDSVKLLLKKELNEMKCLKYIETLKLTFKKAIADKNETKITFKTAYFNSKAKTIKKCDKEYIEKLDYIGIKFPVKMK